MGGRDRSTPTITWRRDGRVMEVLSEHLCEGWLEGYLLTGRHGLFNCYEAFIHIIDSMFNQHAKWLKVTREIPWRAPIASLNYLLSSHVWRQDHNGFSHQDPGFIDHVVNKKAEIVRVYFPPDANCLLSVADHCLRSRGYVNVIVAGKQPSLDYLTMDEAVAHCTRGLGIWDWASNDQGGEPDVVMACAGDIPTLETLAAVALLREHLPELRVRVVNVVDLMRLEPDTEHPHGLPDPEFDALFTTDRPVIFAYHGYPWLIHRLTYRRRNHANLHVRGYKEEGTTTTPFDMLMLNDMDRFHLVMDVIDRVPSLGSRASALRQQMVDERLRHRAYTREVGDDPPDVRDWIWTEARRPTSPDAPERARPRRQRRLEQPQAQRPRRRAPARREEFPAPAASVDPEQIAAAVWTIWARSTPSDIASFTAGTDSSQAVKVDAGGHRRPVGAGRPGAAASGQVAGSAGGGQPPAAGLSARSRALTPPFTPRFRAARPPTRSRGPGASGGGCAASASTACRTPTRRVAPPSCSDGRRTELRIVTCHLGAGASLAAVQGRALRRYDDGLHPARGAGDGDPFGIGRSRAAALAAGAHRL